MQIRRCPINLILPLIALFFIAGCDSRPKRVPVSGKVLIDGEPLKFGSVMFVPEVGRKSTGVLDENGSFELMCYDPGDGALVGIHQVTVLGNEVINNTTLKWHAPKKYTDPRTSKLVEEIKGPTDSIVLNLTWKGSPPEKPFTEHLDAGDGEDAMRKSRSRSKANEE